jgi:hypothetical protein
LFAGDSRQEDGLGRLGGFKIIDAGSSSFGFQSRLCLIGFCLGGFHLLFGQFDESLEDKL